MFGFEATVKHALLQSESPKYLGTYNGMINIELMNKLYMVVAHNLHQARKVRGGNKKNSTVKEPKKLKVGDNVLVRDHTSKALQPKYKDFCIIGNLGKNQIKVKDNHGHTTKVHCRDVKKIPMTEKICQLYEEEQIGKVREGRKVVPANKMPKLGWDIAETDIQTISGQQETTQPNSQQTPHTLQTMITIANLITAVLEHIKTHIQEIPALVRTVTKSTKRAFRRISNTWFIQNIRESHSKARLAVTIATGTTNRTSRTTPTANKQTIVNKKARHVKT